MHGYTPTESFTRVKTGDSTQIRFASAPRGQADEAQGLGHGPFQEPVGLTLSWNRRNDSSNVASRPRKTLEDDRVESP